MRIITSHDPISLTHSQSSSCELGVFNPSFPFNHSDTDLGILLAIWNGLRSCTRHPLSNFLSYHRLNHQHKVFTTHLSVDSVPINIQETLSDARWIKAIGKEMNGLHKNKTWDVVLPLNFKEKNSIGCKWIFTIKYKVDDSIERYKAKLLAKGYTQTYEIDCQETLL